MSDTLFNLYRDIPVFTVAANLSKVAAVLLFDILSLGKLSLRDFEDRFSTSMSQPVFFCLVMKTD